MTGASETLHAPPRRGTRSGEGLAAWGVILGLMGVAAWIGVEQGAPSPAVLALREARRLEVPTSAGLDLAAVRGEGLEVFGPAEHFTAATLADKIDGAAGLYLAAGFRSLSSQRFRLAGEGAPWLELRVYEMDSPEGAFSVFSTQRRPDAVDVGLGDGVYRSANAVFLVSGLLYAEWVGSADDPALLAAAVASARALQALGGGGDVARGAGDLLPAAGRQEGSLQRLATDAFGFEGFDDVYVARYGTGPDALTAFVSRRASAAEAVARGAAYGAFLRSLGGKDLPGPAGAPTAERVELFGSVTLVRVHGDLVYGVQEALDPGAAEDLLAGLARELEGAAP